MTPSFVNPNEMASQCEIKLLIFLLISPSTYCHYFTEPGSIIRGVKSNGKHLLSRRSTDESLRISVYPDTTSVQNLSSNMRKLIDGLLHDAVVYFGKTLSVRQRISPIRLQRDCKKDIMKEINGTLFRYCIGTCKSITSCGPVSLPELHLDTCRTCDSNNEHCTSKTAKSTGLSNTDFVLYFSAIMTSHCNDREEVIAYAAACQQEQTYDRPVAGFVNFCVEKLARNFHYTHLLAVLKHEIFHALGFSSLLYGYYRDDDGTPLTRRLPDGRPASKWSDKVVKEIIRDQWQVSKNAGTSITHKIQMIVTPRVIKEVQNHFSCPGLEGAEIENQGWFGQRNSHLEKRAFENEAMTGVFTNNPVFSRITLALMEDTGWYRADYRMAEQLDWGKNAGCLFAQNSCKAWIDNQRSNNSILPYCSQVPFSDHTRTGCIHNYQAVGICNLVKYKTPLPKAYRYFSTLPRVDKPSYYGGAIALADYCPYFQELDWKQDGVRVRGSNCKHKSNNPTSKKNYALEMYGDDSACFLHGRAWKQKSCSETVIAVDWGSGCYLYKCTVNGLALSISGQSYPCWFTGQILNVKVIHNKMLHQGSIICPPCDIFCGINCPLVNSKLFYNFTSLPGERNENVLVCSSVNLHQSCVAVFLSVLVSGMLCSR